MYSALTKKIDIFTFLGFFICFIGVLYEIISGNFYKLTLECIGPEILSFKSGRISDIFLDAPVDVGTIDWLADRALLGSL